MWLRGFFTLVCLTLAGAAFALWDCVDSIIGDPLGLCTSIDALSIPRPLWVSVGMAGIAFLGLLLVWLPYLIYRVRHRRVSPEKRLIENIGRLPELPVDLRDDPEPPGEGQDAPELQDDGQAEPGFDADHQTDSGVPAGTVSELEERVEVVEKAFANDAHDSRSLTREWIRLLRETNSLHNSGVLSTEDFKELNTRLLHALDTVDTPTRVGESAPV